MQKKNSEYQQNQERGNIKSYIAVATSDQLVGHVFVCFIRLTSVNNSILKNSPNNIVNEPNKRRQSLTNSSTKHIEHRTHNVYSPSRATHLTFNSNDTAFSPLWYPHRASNVLNVFDCFTLITFTADSQYTTLWYQMHMDYLNKT